MPSKRVKTVAVSAIAVGLIAFLVVPPALAGKEDKCEQAAKLRAEADRKDAQGKYNEAAKKRHEADKLAAEGNCDPQPTSSNTSTGSTAIGATAASQSGAPTDAPSSSDIVAMSKKGPPSTSGCTENSFIGGLINAGKVLAAGDEIGAIYSDETPIGSQAPFNPVFTLSGPSGTVDLFAASPPATLVDLPLHSGPEKYSTRISWLIPANPGAGGLQRLPQGMGHRPEQAGRRLR